MTRARLVARWWISRQAAGSKRLEIRPYGRFHLSASSGGQPRGLRGEEIPLLGRILCLAQTAEIFHSAGGLRAAWRVARGRRGRWFDPALVDAFGTLRGDTAFWDSLSEDEIASWEPADRLLTADDARLDLIAVAFAGVVDAKSPWTYRHSDRACLIATGLASALGADARLLRD